jgi:predicted transcriptional regulator of viral defense system
MRTELAALAAKQGGVFTRAQAMDAGYRGPELRSLTGVGGDWVVVRRGVYAERATWEALDRYAGQQLARAWAAHVTIGVDHVMSHDSAAHAWGLPVVLPRSHLVHITRPGVWGSRTEHGVKHHLAMRPPSTEIVVGLPVTGLARTAMDLAREHGYECGAAAADRAMRWGVIADDFDEVTGHMKSWPGVTRARHAAAVADPGADTPGETLTRLMLLELGIGVPVTQFPVPVSNGVAWCDLLVGRHVVEFDGRRKYRDAAAGGDAERAAEEIVWAEKVRERDVTAHGLGMSRVFWEDCLGRARFATMDRLRREYDATVRRYGNDLPDDLTHFAMHMADQRMRRIRTVSPYAA